MALRTCGNDERLLEPVDGGGRGGADDAADLVVLVDHRVLLLGGVIPRDANWKKEELMKCSQKEVGCSEFLELIGNGVGIAS